MGNEIGNAFNDVGNAFESVGKDIGKAANDVGNFVEDTANDIAHETEKAAKEVEKGVNNAAKEIEKGAKEVEKGVNIATKEIEKGANIAVNEIENLDMDDIAKGIEKGANIAAKEIENRAKDAANDVVKQVKEIEVDVGCLHIAKGGKMEVKPQWKAGIKGDNFNVGGGVDFSDGQFKIGAEATVSETFYGEGKDLLACIENLKCNGFSKHHPRVAVTLAATNTIAEIVRSAVDELDIDLEVMGKNWYVAATGSCGVGIGASFHLGELVLDDEGYAMQGAAATIPGVGSGGCGVGVHKDKNKVKIVASFSAVTCVFKVDVKV